MTYSHSITSEYRENKKFIDGKRERELQQRQRSAALRDRAEIRRRQLQAELDAMSPADDSLKRYGEQLRGHIRSAMRWSHKGLFL